MDEGNDSRFNDDEGSTMAARSTVHGRPLRPKGEGSVLPGDARGPIARIGPYTILEEIGSGGMGRVFLARQEKPLRRKVALKLMRTSLSSSEAVARFSAERQAMARLGHPNVARIFDAGTTDDGNPYFVMEHVPGVPITEYCDGSSASVGERLRLFLQVCAGVHHAHLNQILHRDLKPSNVLISEVDGEPSAKIIDFGIAKALDRPLTEQVLETGDRLIGTPAYMSPEALRGARSGDHRIDARTDVYSLGVLLYELLAGTNPFDLENGFVSVIRQICDEDPPRPSHKVSGLKGTRLSGVADSRRIEPAQLARRLSGDLDWIVGKAISKDPDDRYSSASELAAEIERHLAHEPVLAGPRTWRYRFGKLVRRHRFATAATAIALLAMVAGIAGTTFGLFAARREAAAALAARAEEQQAREEAVEVSRFLVDLFEQSDPSESRGQEVTARELLERGADRISRELAGQPRALARMLVVLGEVHDNLGLYERAVPLLEQAVGLRRRELGERHLDVAEGLVELGAAYRGAARLEDSIRALREAQALQESLDGTESPLLPATLRNLAATHTVRGEYSRSEELLLRALDIAERTAGPASQSVARISSALGACYAYQGLYDRAEPLFRQALAINEELFGSEDPAVATNLDSLALIASRAGRVTEAEELFRRALAIDERFEGEEHPNVRLVLGNLGYTLFNAGRYEDALQPLERAVALDEAAQTADTSAYASRLTNLGLVYWKLGRLEEAEPLFHRATAIRERILAPGHPHRATSIWGLANVYRDEGRYEEAEALYLEALRIRKAALPPGNRERIQAMEEYAELMRRMGRDAEAAELERTE